MKNIINECKLRNFSKGTIKAYVYYNEHFLNFIGKSPLQVTQEDLKKYLLYLTNRNKSSSTVNLAHNALNFYYTTILKRKFNIPFQKREHKIQYIASLNDIKKMITVTKNIKHKLMIEMLYCSGVRRSELVKIKLKDIDYERKLIFIRNGKGKKDRFTVISDLILFDIKNYLKNRPYQNEYLFASNNGHLTSSTVEAVIKQARVKANLRKITPHTLRRSFATHNLHQGTPETYIQKMMGHNDIRTTQGYWDVPKEQFSNVKRLW
ncbi:MAG: tyrosine-type recombinase/integrase [Candidatus Woesearchaeota archaeon]